MCDPKNKENVICEDDQDKIEIFMDNLYFELYMLQLEADVKSNEKYKL